MHQLELLTVVYAYENKLVRSVVAVRGSVFCVCRTEQLRSASVENREPQCTGVGCEMFRWMPLQTSAVAIMGTDEG